MARIKPIKGWIISEWASGGRSDFFSPSLSEAKELAQEEAKRIKRMAEFEDKPYDRTVYVIKTTASPRTFRTKEPKTVSDLRVIGIYGIDSEAYLAEQELSKPEVMPWLLCEVKDDKKTNKKWYRKWGSAHIITDLRTYFEVYKSSYNGSGKYRVKAHFRTKFGKKDRDFMAKKIAEWSLAT